MGFTPFSMGRMLIRINTAYGMPKPMKRKNILFIMADQMAAPMLPIYGPSPIKLPNLSRLAAQGVVFDAAYCNSPLCAPSRFTLVSGQLPSKIGAYDNAADFPADVPTYAHYLRRLGYRTALSGKMHFCGPDQLHGYEERLTSDIYPADYGWAVNWDEPDVRPPGTTTCPRCCKPGRACAPTSWISTKRWCSRPSSTCSTTFAKTATSRSA
jgi:choline-sulfatase